MHESAVNAKQAGHLDEQEVRSLHERIARHYGFDVRHLVRAELDRLAARRRQPTSGFSGFAPLREDDDVVPVSRVRSID